MRKVSLFSIQENDFKPPKSILKPLPKATEPQQKDLPNDNDQSQPNSSLYGIVAATKISKGIKEKTAALMVRRRKHGDWGEYELTHAWSPEELNQDQDGRSISPASRIEREMTSVSEFIVNMARPYVMKPVKPFQVCLA